MFILKDVFLLLVMRALYYSKNIQEFVDSLNIIKTHENE